MSRYSLEVHPEALQEAIDAKRWYAREGGAALGEDFMDRVDALLDRLRDGTAILSATRHVPRALGVKRVRFARFPYSLFVALEPHDTVLVLAVAHHRRRPGYWLPRLVK